VDGSQNIHFQGLWGVGAGAVRLYAEDTTADGTVLSEDPYAYICAVSTDGSKGFMGIHGDQGVRITSGLPNEPPIDNKAINGVEVQTGETQEIHILRGLDQGSDQSIEMTIGNILIDGGSGSVRINATTEISFNVVGGTSSITLTPTGIVMQGPLIQIN
jgi:hypothetical protein